ncbi:MAG: hypothetical protein ACLFQX_13220 [Candidatus Kapaibacterium sp.]
MRFDKLLIYISLGLALGAASAFSQSAVSASGDANTYEMAINEKAPSAEIPWELIYCS